MHKCRSADAKACCRPRAAELVAREVTVHYGRHRPSTQPDCTRPSRRAHRSGNCAQLVGVHRIVVLYARCDSCDPISSLMEGRRESWISTTKKLFHYHTNNSGKDGVHRRGAARVPQSRRCNGIIQESQQSRHWDPVQRSPRCVHFSSSSSLHGRQRWPCRAIQWKRMCSDRVVCYACPFAEPEANPEFYETVTVPRSLNMVRDA